MRTHHMSLVLAASVVLTLGCGAEAGNGGSGAAGSDGSSLDGSNLDGSSLDGTTAADGSASDQVAIDLVALREEEKLARDVYLTLFDKFGLNIHQNIAGSEQSHTDAVKARLAALGITDPVQDDTVGVFTSAEFAKLYAELVAAGSKSELDALLVGATIEDLDLYDIEVMRSHTSDADLLALYDSLACGSRNHLRSFTSQIASRKGSYAPQYISQATYDAILAGSNESCGGADGNGGRGGRGGGRGGNGGGRGGNGG